MVVYYNIDFDVPFEGEVNYQPFPDSDEYPMFYYDWYEAYI